MLIQAYVRTDILVYTDPEFTICRDTLFLCEYVLHFIFSKYTLTTRCWPKIARYKYVF